MIQQGNLVEVEITDLSNSGEGVGRVHGCVIFVPDTVTGDRALVRLVRVKRQYSQGKLEQLLSPSPHRLRPTCIVADKCGGCQWQHIDYNYQLAAKQQQITETLARVGGFKEVNIAPILPSQSCLEYRNKATYPVGISANGKIQAGYYRRGSHQIVNLNQCPVQDPRLNPLLAEVKQDIDNQGWSIYNENLHQGKLRHISLRIGRRTGEILLTLITTDWDLPQIESLAQVWLQRYRGLVGVTLNYNPRRTNVIFGSETRTIAGRGYLRETFADLEFHLRPETFFQVNTEAAQSLLEAIIQQLELKGNEVLVDAYCGIGTFTLPLAQRVKQAIGIEVHTASIAQGKINAQINGIDNVNFLLGNVEDILPQLEIKPDLVILDPPRKGCDRTVLTTLLRLLPPRLVYVSCQPATLARDLQILCQNGIYQLIALQPADFFPQTSHVECAAFLQHY